MPTRERYKNALVATQLNGAINSSTTTVVVDDASGFPTDSFRVLCDSEIMYCTSRSSNTLTVIRAQEGTGAASHSDDAVINHIATAGVFDAFKRNIYADLGMKPFEAGNFADDDRFEDESFSGWTEASTTPAITKTEKNARLSLSIPNGSAAAQMYAFLKAKAPSAGDYVQAGFQICIGNPTQYPSLGVCMANGTTYGTSDLMTWVYSLQEMQYFIRYMADMNSNTNQATAVHAMKICPQLHMRLTWVSNNTYHADLSPDAISWARIYSSHNIGSLGTPTHMGFCYSSWGSSGNQLGTFLYCRFSF